MHKTISIKAQRGAEQTGVIDGHFCHQSLYLVICGRQINLAEIATGSGVTATLNQQACIISYPTRTMSSLERLFASYHLWSLIAPASGQERWHCQMRRGYVKARQNDPLVQKLLASSTAPQRVGLLAQKGVYEFHYNQHLLHRTDGPEKVAQLLKLNHSSVEIQQRVLQILKKYHDSPFLLDKCIIQLTRGDEGFPKPIYIENKNYFFRLYASMDCVFIDDDNQLHIIDFKTGKSSFDRRQALVYLLAARYLYPHRPAVASFYNLEVGKKSDLITATQRQLDDLEAELAEVARQHQQDVQKYHQDRQKFSKIFPANPGGHCRFCPFSSICEFSASNSSSLPIKNSPPRTQKSSSKVFV